VVNVGFSLLASVPHKDGNHFRATEGKSRPARHTEAVYPAGGAVSGDTRLEWARTRPRHSDPKQHDPPGIMRAVRWQRPALSLHRQPALPQSYQPEHAGGLETAITGRATASGIEAVIVPVQDVDLGKQIPSAQ
jgi:hypothetical protein